MIRSIAALLLAFEAFLPSPATAHLLHEQNGTMKIAGNSANFVISVPVSALDGVDLNEDGLLSPAELQAGHERIVAQFTARFDVFDGENASREVLTWVVSPETHNRDAPTSYVVAMQRVFFDEEPVNPRISFDLFGRHPDEREFSFRASHGENSEFTTFTPNYREHTFFRDGMSSSTGSVSSATNALMDDTYRLRPSPN